MARLTVVYLLFTALLIGLASTDTAAAELKPETLDAWATYVRVTEARIAKELRDDRGFLVLDFQSRPESIKERREVIAGGVVVSEMASRDRTGNSIAVPSGAIHHWRGSVFIPGLHLEDVLKSVKQPSYPGEQQEDVLESRILSSNDDSMRLFLKLQRSNIVTVVYNTEHDIRYRREDDNRASSTSRATKIAEVVNAGSPAEYEKPEGQDLGFLWRLNSYWRYEEVRGGVIVECESMSLSRGIPSAVRPLVGRLIERVARESMERTLVGMRDRLVHRHAAAVLAAAQ